MAEKMEIIMDKKNMNEAAEIMDFVQVLNKESQNDFCQFLRGVKYGLTLAAKKEAVKTA